MAKIYPIAEAALRLRNANPEGFDQFVNILNELTMDMLVSLSDATNDRVLIAQGQCQQMRWFLRMLRECNLEPKQKPAP